MYIETDLYAKIPSKDMSGSDYVGTWVTVGLGEQHSYTPFSSSLDVEDLFLMDRKEYDEHIKDGTVNFVTPTGSMILLEELELYDNGRALSKSYDDSYKGTWEEIDAGVHYKPFVIQTAFNLEFDYYTVESINGTTPQDLGFSGNVFLIPTTKEDREFYESNGYTGYQIYAKK